jgi:hypothetical protein
MPQYRDPAEIMAQALATFRERQASYRVGGRQGNEVHAEVLRLLLPPDRLAALDAAGYERFVLFNFILGKLVRYGLLLPEGGHQDSIHDIAVYAAILDSYHKEPVT